MSELSVSWLGRRVKRGDVLSVDTSSREPVIEYRSPDSSYATLVVTDLDAPYPERPEKSPFLHWLIVNFRNPGISTGEILFEYSGPNPPKDSAQHRYLFEVYQQNKRIDANPVTERSNFNIQKFARDHDVELELKADNQIRVGPTTVDFPGRTSTTAAASVAATPSYTGAGKKTMKHYPDDNEHDQWVSVHSQVGRSKPSSQQASKPYYRGGSTIKPTPQPPIDEDEEPEITDHMTTNHMTRKPYKGGNRSSKTSSQQSSKIYYHGGRQYLIETNEPIAELEEAAGEQLYPQEEVIEVRRMAYTGGCGCGRKLDYKAGARKPKGPSHDPAAFCRGALHVEAKNDPSCEKKNWPRGEGCYNPYAVAAYSTGTSVGRGTCAPYIDPEELNDSDLAAYVRLTNHKLRQKGLKLIPIDLPRKETLAKIKEYKAQLLKAEGR